MTLRFGDVAAALVCATALAGAQGTARQEAALPAPARKVAPRNPEFLHASQLLDRRMPGAVPRVRFEWEQVRGATLYLLTGRWTTPPSWTVQSREYRVTREVATSWTSSGVTFDVSLPQGNHSWKLIALFGPAELADFGSPTPLSFEVR